MNFENAFECLNLIRAKAPLIHCLTNNISINDAANVVLSLGARPIMSEHPMEVAEVTACADCLLINIGNINDVRIKSIFIAAEVAHESSKPIVFDPVGAAGSDFRKSLSMDIIKHAKPTIIKGNMSEIKTIANIQTSCSGVDVGAEDVTDYLSLEKNCRIVAELASSLSCTVIATGAMDIIAGDGEVCVLRNGTPLLSKITGTGCVTGVIVAAYATVANPVVAAVAGVTHLNVAGEFATEFCQKNSLGLGSFKVALLDKIGGMKVDELIKGVKM